MLSQQRYLQELKEAAEAELEHEREADPRGDYLPQVEHRLEEINAELAELEGKAESQRPEDTPIENRTELQLLEEERENAALAVLDEDPGAHERLAQVDRRIEELKNGRSLEALAAKARARREKSRKERERTEAIAQMDEMLAELEAERDELIDQAKVRINPGGQFLENIWVTARQCIALAHDLLGVTGDSKYRRTWDLRGMVGPELAGKMPQLHPMAAKVPVPRPWAELLEKAKEGGNA